MRRYRTEPCPPGAAQLPPRVRGAYDWLARAARGETPGGAAVDRIWARECAAAADVWQPGTAGQRGRPG